MWATQEKEIVVDGNAVSTGFFRSRESDHLLGFPYHGLHRFFA
jgi:hypothetical protein